MDDDEVLAIVESGDNGVSVVDMLEMLNVKLYGCTMGLLLLKINLDKMIFF